ncbi:hypothetical protein [Deinococcus marmoris]|uniref:hypothetical protein n=1 Tax=Deinococcus marmoris TaxID=249408 RepID=UPI00096A4F0B|nr:hypothetical protein [Deinococcus marmoris]
MLQLPDVPFGDLEIWLFDTDEGRSVLYQAIPIFLEQVQGIAHTPAGQELSRLQQEPTLDDKMAKQAMTLIQMIRLAYHEASHVAASHLFLTEDQYIVGEVSLPGGPDLLEDHDAAANGYLRDGPQQLDYVLTTYIAPETMEPTLEVFRKGKLHRTGGDMSSGDLEAMADVKRKFEVASQQQGFLMDSNEAETEARSHLQLHRTVLKDATGLVAGIILNGIVEGDLKILAEDLEKTLNSRFRRGELISLGD